VDERLLDLLGQRELDACVECWRLARELVAREPQSATFEALLEATDSVLGDLGEHGFAHLQLPEADYRLMLADSVAAVKTLRASGLDDGAAFVTLNRGRSLPIGSREWFDAMKRGVAWRSEAGWFVRVLAREADDE